jgi:hypothetical protein
MAQKVTLNEIMTAVREITFDRFIVPAFALKEMGEGVFVSVDKDFTPLTEGEESEVIKGRLVITRKSSDTEEPTEENIVSLTFQEYPTMEGLLEALIANDIIVSYTPYFRGEEPSTSLIKVTNKELTENVTLFRRYFFSDEEIEKWIQWYYWRVLDIPNAEINDELIGKLVRPSEKHMALWVSYYLVGRRRLFEIAAGSIGQSFTDGSDYVGSDLSDSTGTTTTTQIGSVFTITEDPTKGYFYEDFNRVGSDNVLGDRYSFWYRLQLWIRETLEEMFGDYSLRKDQVIPGYIELQRELDFRSYYDSYPFTLSPLSRGILSKTP